MPLGAIAGGLIGAGGAIGGALLGKSKTPKPKEITPSFVDSTLDPLLSQVSLDQLIALGGDPATILRQQSPLLQMVGQAVGNPGSLKARARRRASNLRRFTPEQLRFLIENRGELESAFRVGASDRGDTIRGKRVPSSEERRRRRFMREKAAELEALGLSRLDLQQMTRAATFAEKGSGMRLEDVVSQEAEFQGGLEDRLSALRGESSRRESQRNTLQDQAMRIALEIEGGAGSVENLASEREGQLRSQLDDVRQDALRRAEFGGLNPGAELEQLAEIESGLNFRSLREALELESQRVGVESGKLSAIQAMLVGQEEEARKTAALRTGNALTASQIAGNQLVALSNNASNLAAANSARNAELLGAGVLGAANNLSAAFSIPSDDNTSGAIPGLRAGSPTTGGGFFSTPFD